MKVLGSIESSILRKDNEYYYFNVEIDGEPCEFKFPFSLLSNDLVVGQSIRISSIEDDEEFKRLRISVFKPKADKEKLALLKEIEEFVNS